MIDPGCLVATPHLLFLPPRPTPSRPGQCGASNDGTAGKMMRNRGSLDDFGRCPEFSRPKCKINQYCHFEDLDCRLRWQVPWCAATRIRTTACAFAAVAGPRFASNNGIPNRWSLGDLHFGKCPDDNVIDDH